MLHLFCLILIGFLSLFEPAKACIEDPYSSKNSSALQHFDLGKKHFEAEDFQKAKQHFTIACDLCPPSSYLIFEEEDDVNDRFGPMCQSSIDPIYLHSKYYLGLIRFQEQNFVKALYHFLDATGILYYDYEEEENRLSFLTGVNPSWLIHYGLTRLAMQNEEAAILHFGNAIDHLDYIWTYVRDDYQILKQRGKGHPWFFQMVALAYSNMAIAYYNMGEYQLALEAITYAIAIDEGKPWTVFIKEWNEEKVYIPYYHIRYDINKYPLSGPGNPFFYNNLGFIYLALERYHDALAAFQRALELNPEDIDSLKNRALVNLILRNDSAAINDYSLVLERQPQSIETRKNRILAHLLAGNEQEAHQEKEILKQWEAELLYHQNNEGLRYLSEGNYHKALQAFSDFIHSSPQLAAGYKNRARTYFETDQLIQALQDYDHAISIDPQDPTSYLDRGVVKLGLCGYDEAIQDFQSALKIAPRQSLAYEHLGTAFSLLGDYEQSISNYTHAIEIEKKASSFKSRGLIYYKQHEFEKAVADFSQAICLGTSGPDIYQSRGMAFHELGKFKEAVSDFTQAIDLGFQDTSIFCQRGIAQYSNQDFYQALTDLSHAIRLDPENANAYRSRGLVRISLSRVEQGLEDLRKAIEIENPGCSLPSTIKTIKTDPTATSKNPLPQAIIGKRESNAAISFDGGRTYFYPKTSLKKFQSFIPGQESEDEALNWDGVLFQYGLVEGLFLGSVDALKNAGFLAYQLAMDPANTAGALWQGTQELAQDIGSQNWDKVCETLVPELRELYLNWDSLDAFQKGILVGQAIGRNRTDALVTGAAGKVFKNGKAFVKEANLVPKFKKGLSNFYIDLPPIGFKDGVPIYPPGTWVLPTRGRAIIGERCYTEHALARMAPASCEEVTTLLTERLHSKARSLGIEPETEPFIKWLDTKQGQSFRVDPRTLTPLEIEAEIANPGSMNFRVVLNDQGDVVTVVPRGKK